MYAASADCSRDFRYQIRTALSMLLPLVKNIRVRNAHDLDDLHRNGWWKV